MESGTITLPETTTGSTTWQHVTFKQSYDAAPLVFAMPNEGSGYDGDDPAALRIKNVTTTGFDIVQVEAEGQDGPHPEMMPIHYLAMDAGEHTLPDGTKIIAGTVDTTAHQGKNTSGRSWETVTFSSSFASTPIVLGMIQTVNNEQNQIPGDVSVPWMVTAISNIDLDGFDTALDMVKTDEGTIKSNETIAYLAIPEGVSGVFYDSNGTCRKIAYETDLITDVKGWDNGCYIQDFNQAYSSAPNVIGNMQTRNGGDGGWLRRCSLSETQIGVTVDEDVYRNRKHGKGENAGLLIFSEDFTYDSTVNTTHCDLSAEYRLDECYWLGSGNFDVIDSVGGNDAEAYNDAQPDRNDAIVNFSGDFVSDRYAQTENSISISSEWTFSLWMKFPLDAAGHQDFSSDSLGFDYYFSTGSLNGRGDLPAFTLDGTDLGWAVYDEDGDLTVQDLDDSINDAGWKMVTFVKHSDDTTDLYINGQFIDSIDLGTDGDFMYLFTSDDNVTGQTLSTKVDEVKLWNRALSAQEIQEIYNNESSGKNYDGTSREPVSCSASIAANTWELVGIPADFRNPNNTKKTVADIFGDDMNGTYGTDWRVYRRDYSDSNNSSSYTFLDTNDPLEFGKAYWLGSKLDSRWSENGAVAVDYNSTNPDCPAARCVEIDLKSVSLNFGPPDNDPDDGTGPYRYNMTGFVGKSPVDWADCRFIVDGAAYTPSAFENAGYGSKQIWQYNPGDGNADSNGYTTCDDTTPGSCKLEPYKGFWVELHGPSKGKTIKLLIPKE
ncbi:hypothetical protein Nitsa_1709 [Nitratifractor salsuginis DSM 16511]|uniref:H-type lectin domain-containing protein n=2 Tax=Nitratifractor salsuginis TaxID=269261 RepID=E6X193_NITSE|nr:hypothetical protein Nitsa_1709 [Nitratifractor salsuginis DSM 16511]